MAEAIEYRRIFQKVATYDEWMANPLILGDGEQAFVRGGGVILNFRMGDGTKRFSELPNVIQYDQAAYVAPTGNTLPSPDNGIGYSILTPGSYNNGTLVVPDENLGVADFAAGSWSVRNTPLPQPVGVDFIRKDGDKVPTEAAVYKLAISPLVEGDIASSTYDLTIDNKGWVKDFENKRTGEKSIEYPISYYSANFKIDEKGWIQQGLDYKGGDIAAKTSTYNDDRIIYNVTSDYKGWIISIEKIYTKYQHEESNLVAPTFSDEITVVPSQAKHNGFPGACYSLNGVLHVFYRESAIGHVGTDGTIKYTYSRNQGDTWSTPVVVLQGGAGKGNGYFLDWRDSKVIRVGNKLFLSAWSNYAKSDPQATPYPYSYDNDINNYIVSFDINTDGTANIDSANRVLVPRVNGLAIAGSGGIYEYANVIYCTGYSVETTNRSFLFKSEDMGASFQLVSNITDNGNENAIAFMEKSLYCLQRLTVGNDAAKLFRSDDKGLTWVDAGQLEGDSSNRWIHGHSLKNMGNYLMAVGRGGASGGAMVRFIDETGRSLIPNFAWNAGGDGSYSQIAQWQKIVSVVYYKQFSSTNWGIVMRKVNVNNISNLY